METIEQRARRLKRYWAEEEEAAGAARAKAAAVEETAEEIGDRILRAAAGAYSELEVAGVENALEAAARNAGIAARDLAEFIREQRAAAEEAAKVSEAMEDLAKKRAVAHARRAARKAKAAVESPQEAAQESEKAEVPESPEVKAESQRRAFAKMAGVSPRRRRAERFLEGLRAK